MIEEMKDCEEAKQVLSENANTLKTVLDETAVGIMIIDPLTHKIVDVNQTAVNLVGESKDKIIDSVCHKFVCPTEAGECPVTDIGQTVIDVECVLLTASGGTIPILKNVASVNLDGHMLLLESFIDISRIKQFQEDLRQSEERYGTILDEMDEGYYEIDPEGNFIFVNDAVCRRLGYSKKEILGMNYKVLLDRESKNGVVKTYSDVFRSDTPCLHYPTQEISKDGSIHYMENSIFPLRNAKGEIIGVRGIGHDVTEQRIATDKLSTSERLYRLLADNMSDSVWMMDMNLGITYVSPSAERMRGYTIEEILTLPLEKQITPQSFVVAMDMFTRVLKQIEEGHRDPIEERYLELEFIRKDGTTFWLECHFTLIRDENDQPVSILTVGRDITERRAAEQAKEESEKHYKLLAENTSDVVIMLDKDFQLSWVSDSYARQNGFTAEEMKELTPGKMMKPESLKSVIEATGQMMEEAKAGRLPEGQRLKLNLEHFRKDGTTMWTENEFSVMRNEHGETIGLLVQGRNITERILAERAREESEKRYRLIADNSSDFIWILDRNLQIQYISPSVEKERGYTLDELRSMTVDQQMTPDSFAKVAEVMTQVLVPEKLNDPNSTNIGRIEIEYYRKNGSSFLSEAAISILRDDAGNTSGFLGIGRDVTERKKMEKALLEEKCFSEALIDSIPATFYVIDDNIRYIRWNKYQEKILGYSKDELGGMNPLETIATEERDRIIDQIVQILINGTGEIDATILTKEGDRIPFLLSMTTATISDKQYLIGFGIDVSARKQAEGNLEVAFNALQKSLQSAIDAMVRVGEMRDPYTAGHQRRVANLAGAIAQEMNLDDSRVEHLIMAAKIHDIGKMFVPSDILSKPGILSDIEYKLVKTHAQGSYDILRDIEFTRPVAVMALQHHERLDGSGYPNGLKGGEILTESRILAVADVVEAMSSYRPYRAALGIDKALEEISSNSGVLYDKDVVNACLRLFNEQRFKFTE